MKKQKVQAKINLEALAGGAFAEKLNEALMQVAENIQNPNTEATTKRQITVNIKFTPNKTRQMAGLCGVPERTRTSCPQFRKLLLYPDELRGHAAIFIAVFAG